MVGQKTHSNWGEGFSFKLHGLDTSNYLAYYRFIVLHSADYVPEEEIYPTEIQNSSGCPTVSHQSIHQLKKQILEAQQPVLLWLFYDGETIKNSDNI